MNAVSKRLAALGALTRGEAEYAKTPATEAQRFPILSGAIFPIYDKIMGSSGIHNVKIARATLVDGRALVGLPVASAEAENFSN